MGSQWGLFPGAAQGVNRDILGTIATFMSCKILFVGWLAGWLAGSPYDAPSFSPASGRTVIQPSLRARCSQRGVP